MKKKSGLPLILAMTALALGAGCIIFFLNFAIVGGSLYPLSAKTLDLKNSGVENMSVLNRFSRLESADLSGCNVKSLPSLKRCAALKTLTVSGSDFSAEECIDFYEQHPDARLICGVKVDGKSVSSLTRTIAAAGGMKDEEIRQFAALRQLESLDLTGTVVGDGEAIIAPAK